MFITDLPYFGPISFWQTIAPLDAILFDNAAPFSKMSFKNRMVIASAQGPLHLTIPIIGGRDQKTPIQAIRIAYDTPWHQQHFKAIVSSYQRSPYFEYYRDSIEAVYNSKPEYLVDFLYKCHHWAKKQVKGKWNILEQSIEDITINPELTRHYHPWLPKNYTDCPSQIQYQQVFQETTGFLPNLSILDILFCCGGKYTSGVLK